jgi:hypothetical protein
MKSPFDGSQELLNGGNVLERIKYLRRQISIESNENQLHEFKTLRSFARELRLEEDSVCIRNDHFFKFTMDSLGSFSKIPETWPFRYIDWDELMRTIKNIEYIHANLCGRMYWCRRVSDD